MAVQKETFVIGGHLKMRRSGSGLPFQKCGLVSTIQTTIETNNLTLGDTTTPQGGEYDSVDRITGVGLSINFREFFTPVLAGILWGDVTTVPSATHTDEQHVAAVDGTIALDQMPLEIDGVTNVVDGAPGTVTFEEFDDWVMTGSGIEVVAGGALEQAILAAAPGTPYSVSVDYKSAAVDVVEALTNSGLELELLFEGENAAGTKKRIEARFWKCRLNPASSQDWLSVDDFMGAESTCKVISDPTKVGTGKSKYFRVKKELPVAA
ncbi:hypothetical protein N7325_13550 [Stutzerimonas stutzeri]|jgi:hypothetical protein|uniref:phage tail tube protein n=1 Tax=Stutzerimonas stutzeri TaxID=316 RepID=UPI00244B5A5C|nr:hypothetical protein [Stutzerimonas stutzeri]MDH0120838.1 hypothetical protein [Stutzerimonas stutzeri]